MDIKKMTRGEVACMLDVSTKTITTWTQLRHDPIPYDKQPGRHATYDGHQVFCWYIRRRLAEEGITQDNYFQHYRSSPEQIREYMKIYQLGDLP